MTSNGRQGSCLRLLICDDVSSITATVAGLSARSDFIVSMAVCLLISVKSEKHNDIRVGRVIPVLIYITYTEATRRSPMDDGRDFVRNFYFAACVFIHL
jgi:hypothetical protein